MSEEGVAYLGQRTSEAAGLPAAIDKLAGALSKAQAKMTNPPKTKSGQCRGARYLYADLADVLDHVRGPLAENGLAVTQIVSRVGGENVLLSRLLHASGQYVESVYPLPSSCGAQEMGSAITYARRYSICPLLGIAGETDDDAQQAQDGEVSADEEKKRQALVRLEAAKGQGRVRSAYDGRVLKAGEAPEAKPAAPAQAVEGEAEGGKAVGGRPEAAKQDAGNGVPPPDKKAAAIDARLAKALKRDGITVEELKAFVVKGGFIGADMDMAKLEENFVVACLMPVNWKKVVAGAKAARVAGKAAMEGAK